MDTHSILPRLISAIMSLLDASNLRTRAYTAEQRVEALELALEDIARINASEASADVRQHLIGDIAVRARASGN